MNVPEDRRYTEEHEWAMADGDGTVRIGITEYAQDALGDIVYVELPEAGTRYQAGDTMAEVESTKSVADIYAPLAGEVAAVNSALVDAPELVNSDPYGDGWFIALKLDDVGGIDGLLDAAAYSRLTED